MQRLLTLLAFAGLFGIAGCGLTPGPLPGDSNWNDPIGSYDYDYGREARHCEKAWDRLDKDFRRGRISRDEYVDRAKALDHCRKRR